MFYKFFQEKSLFSALFVLVLFVGGCAVEASKNSPDEKNVLKNASASTETKSESKTENSKGAKIEIQPNSPADTVRVFYKNLRENRIREAMFLTNLRPAIEGLTDNELKDFQVDFAAVANLVPEQIEINGEIITNEQATVTAKLPDNETGKLGIQQLKLRRENGVWIIMTVDAETEKAIQKDGKNYFYALRIETHHNEAKSLLNNIAKAQMVYSMKNGGNFGDFQQLIEAGFLTDEVMSSASTGYNYVLKVSDDKKQYFVNATPAVYGKTGKLSFLADYDGKTKIRFEEKDKGGESLKK
ncbi:MAG TPA: hypothetical protein PKY59_14530 [Pyrinomonadaceae bacterium]|nr:hypothetical protein [Pyrinomonadaceae bacterium]